jgi:hypothetical protein
MIVSALRRFSLGMGLWLAFTAGEVQARGILPQGTPLLLLGAAVLAVGANHAANTLTRAERRQLRALRCRNRRLERDLADAAGESQTWKARCFAHVEERALDRFELRQLRLDARRRLTAGRGTG